MPDSNKEAAVPRFSENLFFMILPRDLRDILMGDLYEEFHERIIPEYGPEKARWWYRGQVLRSMRFYILKRKEDIMFFILSIIVFILISVLAAVMGGQLPLFINIPSIIVVLIPPFVFAIAATSTKACIRSLSLLLVDQDTPDQKEIKEASRFLKVFGNTSLTLGIFFTLMGVIQMLTSQDSRITATGISICTLTLMYGIAIKCILYVGDERIRNRFLI